MNKLTYIFYFFIALYLWCMAVWSLTHTVQEMKVVSEEYNFCNETGLQYYELENNIVIPLQCTTELAVNSTIWVKTTAYGFSVYLSRYSSRFDVYFYCSMSIFVSGFISALSINKYRKNKQGDNDSLSLLSYNTFK